MDETKVVTNQKQSIMGKALKYQTKEELLLTAKANGVKGAKSTMTKSEIISLLEAKPKVEEKKPTARKRGEYYGG